MAVNISVHATCTHDGGRNARVAIIDLVKSLGGKFIGETYSEIYLEFDAQHTQAIADKISKLELPPANIKSIKDLANKTKPTDATNTRRPQHSPKGYFDEHST